MGHKQGVSPSLMLLFLLLSGFIMAQDDFHEGFVVTRTNDTIYGLVRNRDTGPFGKIYDKIRFKGHRMKKRFGPKDIRSYKMGDDHFKSLLLDGEMSFLKIASEGYVSYYIYEFQEQGEQLVQDVDFLQKGPNTPLVRVTQGLFGLKRNRLESLFRDCPELVEKIKSKQIKHVFEIVDFYNNWKSMQ